VGIWNLKSIHRLIAIAAALITFSSNANSQDLMGFDRAGYGSVVLSQSQSAGSDLQLELSIGNYENEPIINYSSSSVFAQIGRSVGRLDVLTDKGVFPCTAFIVSEKHILTNYHCSKGLLDNEKIGASRIDATQFVAGYTQTGIEEGTKKYTVIPTPVEASKTLDYAVLEVIGDPSQEYGQLKLASTSPAGGDPFWIIGHPMGEGQRISREKCKANNPALSSGKLLHTCDTLPGNSGSPVIDAGLQQVVALHHAGSKADSVNFAILMSEILANSKVLTAYKAPISVQQVTPKTSELTACDALYSAATEAKACFAYEAYFRSCGDHSLAPIAEGYIKEFCQVQETVKIEPKSTLSCGQDAKQCGDEQICSLATKNGRWDTSSVDQFYVQEANNRGLSCGVADTNQLTEKILIMSIQKELNRIGCVVGPADGIWGERTQAAAVKFAKMTGLSTLKEGLLSEYFLKNLSEANNNFCPKPKYSGVKSFAKIYEVSCGDYPQTFLIRTSEVNIKNKTLIMTHPNDTGHITWSGKILTDDVGDMARMKFDKNGFVYEITFLKDIHCGTMIMKPK